ncbi:MAG: asparagine synthase-related protein [Legionellaceae bacterium]|nr:asparagine synthase-related protein [Legionellaceae bacterium]
MELKPVKHATNVRLQDGSELYYFGSSPISAIASYQACLDASLWREHYQPFAVMCKDSNTHDVVLIRDHFGLEPLYYCHYLGKKLIVGQSIPEILEQLPSTPALLESQIDMLFSENKIYTDETLYQGIYRVEPGHIMHFKSNGSVVKQVFWQLDPDGPLLEYADTRDYVEHFSSLMDESICHATNNHTNIAAEFSAGLDSSAVYCAAAHREIYPKLYMHADSPNEASKYQYVKYYEEQFIEHFNLHDIQRIGADDFDPIEVFEQYAAWFAGPAPYLFFMFANPIHKAVSAGKHPILLSGFGGDQCVSGQLPENFFMPELLHQGQYQEAWHELNGSKSIKKMLHFAKYMHPKLYEHALKVKIAKNRLGNIGRSNVMNQVPGVHPYEAMYYTNARAAECALLQGAESYEVRMRIEYSSLVSKKMGFEYRYPLLHPKLLEFMVKVPTVHKRYDGRGRYLIREYLAKHTPGNLFHDYRKKDGLGIVPSTFSLFQDKFEQGCYQAIFKDLRYADRVKSKYKPIELRNAIKGFMLRDVPSPASGRRCLKGG